MGTNYHLPGSAATVSFSGRMRAKSLFGKSLRPPRGRFSILSGPLLLGVPKGTQSSDRAEHDEKSSRDSDKATFQTGSKTTAAYLSLTFSQLAPRLDLEASDLLVSCRERLYEELEARGLSFRPHLWLSDEWFCPDGVPGFAVPFYLADPDLLRLERGQVGFAEGSGPKQCLKLMRHETGHALENAFRLKRAPWRESLFGKSDLPYPKRYRPQVHSRRFVRHLGDGYAQSHPDEDFAETFAIWLRDRPAVWRARYRGWPALAKLEGLHRAMQSLVGKRPVVRARRTVHPLPSIRRRLDAHYKKRRAIYGPERVKSLDGVLKRLLPPGRAEMTGDYLLRKIGRAARREAARRTGVPGYTVDRMLVELARRARTLGLSGVPDAQRLTQNYLARGLHQIPL